MLERKPSLTVLAASAPVARRALGSRVLASRRLASVLGALRGLRYLRVGAFQG